GTAISATQTSTVSGGVTVAGGGNTSGNIVAAITQGTNNSNVLVSRTGTVTGSVNATTVGGGSATISGFTSISGNASADATPLGVSASVSGGDVGGDASATAAGSANVGAIGNVGGKITAIGNTSTATVHDTGTVGAGILAQAGTDATVQTTGTVTNATGIGIEAKSTGTG